MEVLKEGPPAVTDLEHCRGKTTVSALTEDINDSQSCSIIEKREEVPNQQITTAVADERPVEVPAPPKTIRANGVNNTDQANHDEVSGAQGLLQPRPPPAHIKKHGAKRSCFVSAVKSNDSLPQISSPRNADQAPAADAAQELLQQDKKKHHAKDSPSVVEILLRSALPMERVTVAVHYVRHIQRLADIQASKHVSSTISKFRETSPCDKVTREYIRANQRELRRQGHEKLSARTKAQCDETMTRGSKPHAWDNNTFFIGNNFVPRQNFAFPTDNAVQPRPMGPSTVLKRCSDRQRIKSENRDMRHRLHDVQPILPQRSQQREDEHRSQLLRIAKVRPAFNLPEINGEPEGEKLAELIATREREWKNDAFHAEMKLRPVPFLRDSTRPGPNGRAVERQEYFVYRTDKIHPPMKKKSLEKLCVAEVVVNNGETSQICTNGEALLSPNSTLTDVPSSV